MAQMPSTGQLPSTPFNVSLVALETQIYPAPPSGYDVRLFLQMGLFSIGILLGITYLFLSTREARRISKPLRLIRLQPVAGTHLIALNAIWLFVFFDTLDLVCLLAHKVVEYRIHYHHASQHNLIVLTLFTWIPGFLAGFAYTFNILGAALKLRGEGTGWSSASYISVWAHNVLFIFVVSAFLILHIPLSLVANNHYNLRFQAYEVATSLLQQAETATDPSTVSSRLLASIAAVTDELTRQTLEYCRYQKIVASVVVIFPIGFAAAAAASFSLVQLLRKQRKWRNQRIGQDLTPTGIMVLQEQHRRCDTDEESRDVPVVSQTDRLSMIGTDAPFKCRAVVSSGPSLSRKTSSRPASSTDEVLMDRLAKDLSVSVPLICLVCTFFDVAAIVAAVHSYDKGWLWREWPADVYGWTQAVCIIPIFSTFLWNLHTHRMRDPGQKSFSPKSSSICSSLTAKVRSVKILGFDESRPASPDTAKNEDRDVIVHIPMNPLKHDEKAEEVLRETPESSEPSTSTKP